MLSTANPEPAMGTGAGERVILPAQAILLFHQFELLPQPRKRPHPEHSYGARASPMSRAISSCESPRRCTTGVFM